MRYRCIMLSLFCALAVQTILAQRNIDSRIREYIVPQRIVWMQAENGATISNSEGLLVRGTGQSALDNKDGCVLTSVEGNTASVLLDFGKEIQGGLRFVVGQGNDGKPIKIRVRFGESVSEAMSNIGEKGATNDHALRDFEMQLPWLGVTETHHSGFRFARIDVLDANIDLVLKEVIGVAVYRDISYRGSFKSNDERLNKIWEVGAYTVHLNMQEYLWDGIKRDRLVWVGDLHPEVMTINRVFGYNEVVPKSLDFARDTTPLPGWMSGISSYSLWWIIIHQDWYMYHGDLEYLKNQKIYLSQLLNILFTKVDARGKETLDQLRFLDWPSSNNQKGVDAGLQGLLLMAFDAGAHLTDVLGDKDLSAKCKEKVDLMRGYVPDANQSKQAAALLALSGLEDAVKMNEEIITKDGVQNFSTFYGYYMLQAMAKAEDYRTAISYIKTYWGGMLDMGATTFWEDFNIEWLKNAAPIDEIVPVVKVDIHGDYGDYCYRGFRHSLCHGWASGPTAWMSEHILGVKVIEPGCSALKIKPNLGDLDWVEGTFPTPKGDVIIKHRKVEGKIVSDIKAPKGIRVVVE